ncbi:MAG: DUF4249 family protein [Bacteroidota bacterium]
MHYRFKLFIFGIVIGIFSCEEPYELSLNTTTSILAVNGILNDKDTSQSITIIENKALDGLFYTEEIPSLKVELLVNNSEKILLTKRDKGQYFLPNQFKILPNNTYKLVFQKEGGDRYESTVQALTAPSKMDKIYDDFVMEGKLYNGKKLPSNYIYADFQDNPQQKNNYVWTWILWERQNYCGINFIYDIYCNKYCLEIFRNEAFETYSDVLSNGKTIKGNLIAKIPYYNYQGSLLEIRQLNVTPEAFRYFNIFNDQTYNTGTLADVPPAPLIGNIKNLDNPKEDIAGLFTVASADIQKYWIGRENAQGKTAPLTTLLRQPNPHPFNIVGACEEGFGRTSKLPIGWRE